MNRWLEIERFSGLPVQVSTIRMVKRQLFGPTARPILLLTRVPPASRQRPITTHCVCSFALSLHAMWCWLRCVVRMSKSPGKSHIFYADAREFCMWMMAVGFFIQNFPNFNVCGLLPLLLLTHVLIDVRQLYGTSWLLRKFCLFSVKWINTS